MIRQESGYVPPFTMTEEITGLVIEIAELTGRLSVSSKGLSSNLTLRRENLVQTIHSSLAIEQNRLTAEQVSDIIEGKRMLGPPKDIREVKNAYEAYEMQTKLNPYSVGDLLKAHKAMMADWVSGAGSFRSKGAGIYVGDQLIHAGSPPQYVPELIQQLFDWLKTSNLHLLVKSCVFHYEFEFIHPFADGNGRTGRLWQPLILAKWKEFFLWLPIETLIRERQADYYGSLNSSNIAGESTQFGTFMLKVIRDSLQRLTQPDNRAAEASIGEKVLSLLRDNGKHFAKTLAEQIGISERHVRRILRTLKSSGAIERLGSNRSGKWIVKQNPMS